MSLGRVSALRQGAAQRDLPALAAAGVAPAQADVLVSNTGQAASPELSTVNVNALAQGFTTGRRAAGYNLSSIELDFGQAPEPSSKLTVALWSASGSTPNALLHTLTELATVSTGLVAFAAPANTVLDPGTTYFVVARYSGGGIPPSLRGTASDGEDRGTDDAANWSVADTHRFRARTSSGSWSNASSNEALKITVNGSLVPPRVVRAAITSRPRTGGDTYYRKEPIRATLTFSEPVKVTGTPRATLLLDGKSRGAAYRGGSGTRKLVFAYRVQAGDRDANGVSIGVNALARGGDPSMGVQGGGAIKGVADAVDAVLASAGVEDIAGHMVDGSVDSLPALESAVTHPQGTKST